MDYEHYFIDGIAACETLMEHYYPTYEFGDTWSSDTLRKAHDGLRNRQSSEILARKNLNAAVDHPTRYGITEPEKDAASAHHDRLDNRIQKRYATISHLKGLHADAKRRETDAALRGLFHR